MKRFLTGGLAALLALSLLFAACGRPAPGPDRSQGPAGESSSAQAAPDSESRAPESPSPASDSKNESPESPPPAPPPDSESEAPEGGASAPGPESESGAPESSPAPETEETPGEEPAVAEDGWYNTKEEVAEYLHLYDRLPGNYRTKKEAQAAGWSGGNVERYTGEGTAIGGSRFGNREGLLPKAKGRRYTECDIDTVGKSSRGAKRIIFSNDGLVYYTEDHYNTFELLYGEEEG